MIDNCKEVLLRAQTLPAGRCVLRKFKIQDADAVFEYGSDAETVQHLVWEGVSTPEQARRAITDYYWQTPGAYAIALPFTDRCIGCIELRLHPEHDKASFGFVLQRSLWNKGYMTDALHGMLSFAFDRLQVNRVESTHYIGNEASGRVMEKCGMIYEGTALQSLLVKGEFKDVAHYGLLHQQWLER